MTKRARKRGGRTWWTAAVIVVAALLVVWWFRAQRVEAPAPPTIRGMLPSIAEPPDGQAQDEITHEEKEDLERVLRDGGVGNRKP